MGLLHTEVCNSPNYAQLRSPLDSDLSGGLRYPTFEQPRPGEDFGDKCFT